MPDDARVLPGKPGAEAPSPPARFEVPEFLVPKSLAEVRELARLIALAEWAPDSYRDLDDEYVQQKIELAIMHGMTVGLGPIAAVQSIAVIDGMPTIWGDGALSIVERSGLLEDMVECYELDAEEGLVAICTMRRRRRLSPITNRFSMAMAEAAHLTEKEGPWQTYPQRMLKMRARSWTIRDGFADVLRGLHIREEVDDFIEIRGLVPALDGLTGDREPSRARPRPRRQTPAPGEEPAAAITEAETGNGPGTDEPAPDAAAAPPESFTLADAEGGFLDVIGAEALHAEFERIFFDPHLSPDQVVGLWESNEKAREAIARLFGQDALEPALARLQSAEEARKRRADARTPASEGATPRQKPKRGGRPNGATPPAIPPSPQAAAPDPKLLVAIDPTWGDQRVFRHYRARLAAWCNGGMATPADIARFRAANSATENRLRIKLPQRVAELDMLGKREGEASSRAEAMPVGPALN